MRQVEGLGWPAIALTPRAFSQYIRAGRTAHQCSSRRPVTWFCTRSRISLGMPIAAMPVAQQWRRSCNLMSGIPCLRTMSRKRCDRVVGYSLKPLPNSSRATNLRPRPLWRLPKFAVGIDPAALQGPLRFPGSAEGRRPATRRRPASIIGRGGFRDYAPALADLAEGHRLSARPLRFPRRLREQWARKKGQLSRRPWTLQ